MLLVYRNSETFLGANLNPLASPLVAYFNRVEEGKRLREEDYIHDPVQDLGEELAVAFAQKKGLILDTFKEPPPPAVHEDNDVVTQPALPVRDLYLEVKTTSWGVNAMPFAGVTVYYEFSAKLIEGKTQQVLAEGDCRTSNLEVQRAEKRSYEDVIAEHGAKIKREINRTVEECREKLSTQIFFAPVTQTPRVLTTKAVPVPPAPRPSRDESSAPVPQQIDDE